MGIDMYDYFFENIVISRLDSLGLQIKRDKLLNKIKMVMDNEDMVRYFKLAMHARLIDCSKEPKTIIRCSEDAGLMDKILSSLSIYDCNVCNKKEKDSILYLYDEYRAILNNNTTEINNVDLIIIIINCEVRQRLLSEYISLELLRRNTTDNDGINKVLHNIYVLDKPIIQRNETFLRQRILEERDKYEEIIRKQQQEFSNRSNEDILFDNNIMDNIKKMDEGLIDSNDIFIEEQKKDLIRNRGKYLSGGGDDSLLETGNVNDDSNMIDDKYVTKEEVIKFCNKNIKGRQIKKPLNTLINRCKNF